jgi:GTP1/Obg family GTP-binding protein
MLISSIRRVGFPLHSACFSTYFDPLPAQPATILPTGALSRVPRMNNPEELLESARTRSGKVRQLNSEINTTMKRQAFRTFQLTKLDMLCNTLTSGIRRWTEGFPALDSLHPYELALVRLSIDDGEIEYKNTIRKVIRIGNRISDLQVIYSILIFIYLNIY